MNYINQAIKMELKLFKKHTHAALLKMTNTTQAIYSVNFVLSVAIWKGSGRLLKTT